MKYLSRINEGDLINIEYYSHNAKDWLLDVRAEIGNRKGEQNKNKYLPQL